MNRLTIKHQVIILVAGFILMMLAFYMLAWKPQMAELADLEKQQVEAERNLETAKTTLLMLCEVRNKAASTEVEMVKISTKMPPYPGLPELIVDLQNVANDAGVELKTFNPSAPTVQGEYKEIQVASSVQGSYTAIIDFLRRLEHSSRALKVSKIDVKVAEYPDLSLDYVLSAFTMDSTGSIVPPAVTQSAYVPMAQPAAPIQNEPVASPQGVANN